MCCLKSRLELWLVERNGHFIYNQKFLTAKFLKYDTSLSLKLEFSRNFPAKIFQNPANSLDFQEATLFTHAQQFAPFETI